jgi:hypothetical protein
MLNVETFDLLDSLAKVIRNCEKPFGGIQVIMSGDFMQLPPVRGKFCNKSNYRVQGKHQEKTYSAICSVEH